MWFFLHFSWARISKVFFRPTICLFLTHPKVGPRSKNDQKWVFIKYSCIIYHWKSNGKKISKIQKNILCAQRTYCGTQKLVPGHKITKNGCSLSVVLLFIVGKPMEKGFYRIKRKWQLPPTSFCWYLVHRQTRACSYSTLILARAN